MREADPLPTWSAALGLGVALFFLGHLLEPASRECLGIARLYQEQSQDPLALRGAAPHRLFAPLLAWLLGLGGDRYWLFAHGGTVLLLTAVAGYCRCRGSSWPAATAVTLAIAISGPSQVYKVFLGFPEPFGFTLLLLARLGVRRAAVCWGLWFLAVSVHEVAGLFLPWLCWERRRTGAPWREDLLPLLLACGGYCVLRGWTSNAAPAETYSVAFYAGYNPFPLGTPGLCVLTIADSLVVFGPLLFLLGWHFVTADRGQRFALLLFLAGLLGVQCLAIDFHRFVNLLVVPIVGAAQLFAVGKRRIAGIVSAAGGAAASLALGNRYVIPLVSEQLQRCNALVDPQAFGTCVVPALAGLLSLLCAGVVIVVAAGVLVGCRDLAARRDGLPLPSARH